MRTLVRKLLRESILIRPEKCQICNNKDISGRAIHGHHYDYFKWFNLVWCCEKCHKRIHSGAIKLEITYD